MSSKSTITLYDAESILPEKTISPFAVVIRVLLHFKKIEYQNAWVKYSELENIAKTVGAPPTGTKFDGSPYYTIPFLKISHVGKPDVVISDSPKIAAFLEDTFPDPDPHHPRELLPAETRIYQEVFRKSLQKDTFSKAGVPLLVDFYSRLSPSEAEWVASTRKAIYGIDRRGPAPGDTKAEEAAWKGFDEAFDELAARLDLLGEGNFRIVPDKVTYSEMELVVCLNYIRRVSPERGWKRLEPRNGGRWSKLLALYEEYFPKPVV